MKQNVALVLSGGGARGIAHIGAIEELERRGYKVTSVAGTSMGALVGGVYALGKLDDFKQWLLTLDKLKVFRLVDFTLSGHGLIKADKVLNTMKTFVEDNKIEELPIPYVAVAADIVNRKEVMFTEGSVYDAIRASIAIPSVITPVKTAEGILVDGGVINNIPINRVPRNDNDLVIAVNVNADVPVPEQVLSAEELHQQDSVYRKRMRDFQLHVNSILPLPHRDERMGYFDFINKTINMMTWHIAQTTIDNNPVDCMVQVSRESCGTYDFYKAAEQIETGRLATIKALEETGL